MQGFFSELWSGVQILSGNQRQREARSRPMRPAACGYLWSLRANSRPSFSAARISADIVQQAIRVRRPARVAATFRIIVFRRRRRFATRAFARPGRKRADRPSQALSFAAPIDIVRNRLRRGRLNFLNCVRVVSSVTRSLKFKHVWRIGRHGRSARHGRPVLRLFRLPEPQSDRPCERWKSGER